MKTRKYSHSFGNRCIATIVMPEEFNALDPSQNFKVCWSGSKPSRAMYSEYKQWALLVVKESSDRWGKKMLHVFPDEAWAIEPGKEPELTVL